MAETKQNKKPSHFQQLRMALCNFEELKNLVYMYNATIRTLLLSVTSSVLQQSHLFFRATQDVSFCVEKWNWKIPTMYSFTVGKDVHTSEIKKRKRYQGDISETFVVSLSRFDHHMTILDY